LQRCDDLDVVALQAPGLDPWRFDRRVLWDQVLLPLAATRARVDVLHCAAGTLPLVATAPIVATVHDVAWLRAQAHARFYARAYFGAFQLTRYRRARRIIVDSQFSRDELLSLGGFDPARIAVVYPGVASDIGNLRRAPDAQPFALAVGTVERRKNLALVVRALANVPDLRLLSVGPPTTYWNECLTVARELGVAERVKLRGYVPRQELLGLYAAATVVVAPSRYEGFGYSVAQARCAGVPFLAAHASSLPEVAEDAGGLLPVDDVAAWSDALRALVTARDVAEARAAADRPRAIARFDWNAAAGEVARTYRAVAQR
jgi:glycosyltransferase involved in cell wall biosynthesis